MFGLEKNKNSEKSSKELEIEHERLNRKLNTLINEMDNWFEESKSEDLFISDEIKSKATHLLQKIEKENNLEPQFQAF